MEINSSVDLIERNDSFWKHAFNWKYYILPFIIGILILYHYIQTGEEVITKAKFMNTLIGIIVATQLKKQFRYKIAMFFVAGFFSGLVMAMTYIGGLLLINTFDINSIKKQEIINNLLKQNKQLPKNITNDITLINYINENNNAIISQFKINDTKENIMSEFNNISDFERFMLNNELEISCKDKNVQTILSSGLIIKMEYQDRNGNILGKISLDKNKCDLYSNNKN